MHHLLWTKKFHTYPKEHVKDWQNSTILCYTIFLTFFKLVKRKYFHEFLILICTSYYFLLWGSWQHSLFAFSLHFTVLHVFEEMYTLFCWFVSIFDVIRKLVLRTGIKCSTFWPQYCQVNKLILSNINEDNNIVHELLKEDYRHGNCASSPVFDIN